MKGEKKEKGGRHRVWWHVTLDRSKCLARDCRASSRRLRSRVIGWHGPNERRVLQLSPKFEYQRLLFEMRLVARLCGYVGSGASQKVVSIAEWAKEGCSVSLRASLHPFDHLQS